VSGQPVSSFAGLLRQLRAEAGLTQEELAEAAGLGLRTVSDLERGTHRTAHQDTARLLAGALGLAGPAQGLFVAAARGRADAGEVLAARREAPAALAAMATANSVGPAVVPVPWEVPADVAAFTGRAVELAELDLLLPDEAMSPGGVWGPVIGAVSGTAGVGKTALVVRWAHRVRDRFPDGQLYVNLRGYDPGQPVPAGEALARFLRALGVADQDVPLEEEERAARYRSLLAGRRLLVVLDNAATVEQVRPLLPGSGPVMAVVTSRDSLAGLVARDGARRVDLDLLPPGEAVALLTSLIGGRAEADQAAAERLAEQCARLPLALRVAAELAAARPGTPLAVLTAELAGQAERLELLDAGGDPQSAVAGVFSWSYRYLPEDAATMFRLLGLHPAQDWEEYAAAALTGTESLAQARRLFSLLARAHLIQPASAGRYQMHDLLRAYAASQTRTHDSDRARTAALTRLFDYYLAASGAAMDAQHPSGRDHRPSAPSVSSPMPGFADRAAARAWLDAELATLVSVAVHTAGQGWPSHAARLATTLFVGYLSGGHDTEALAIQTSGLNAARDCGDRAAQAETLHNLGYLHYRHGDYQQAAASYQRSLELAKDVGDQHLQTWALGGLGIVHDLEGRLTQGVDCYRQAIASAQQRDDKFDQGTFQNNLGILYARYGRYQQAAELAQSALAIAREIGDRAGEGYSLAGLGDAHYGQARYQEATSHLRRAIATAREVGDRWVEADALTRLGRAWNRQGRYAQAAECHQQALAIYQETGERDGHALALIGAGETLLATGQPGQAQASDSAALSLSRQSGDRYLQAYALTGLGEISQRLGQHAQSAEYHQQALALFQAIDAWGGQTEALNGTGEALLATGQRDQSCECHTAALTLSRQTGDRYQQARAHRGLGAACQAAGQLEQARQHWQHALDIYGDLGVPEASLMRSDLTAAGQA
jgi:tetratricopeptide (TPR) repeat protein/transcriptional regulator with XRE-family HTH domain